MSQSEFVWCPLIFTAETIVANIYEAIPKLLALGLPSGSMLKNLPVMLELQAMKVWYLGTEDPLEEGCCCC